MFYTFWNRFINPWYWIELFLYFLFQCWYNLTFIFIIIVILIIYLVSTWNSIRLWVSISRSIREWTTGNLFLLDPWPICIVIPLILMMSGWWWVIEIWNQFRMSLWYILQEVLLNFFNLKVCLVFFLEDFIFKAMASIIIFII